MLEKSILIKYKDNELFFEIRKELNEIKDFMSQVNLGENQGDSETARLLDFSLTHLADLIEYLSDDIKVKYPSQMWLILENLGKSIRYNEVNYKTIKKLLTSKDFTDFEQLVITIIEKEQYDFAELEELEKRKKKYRLANSYDEKDSSVLLSMII